MSNNAKTVARFDAIVSSDGPDQITFTRGQRVEMELTLREKIDRMNSGTETLNAAGSVWVPLEEYEDARQVVNELAEEVELLKARLIETG